MTPDVTPRPIHPGVRIGHVHLKVADLERSLRFYCGVLGFELKGVLARCRSESIPGQAN